MPPKPPSSPAELRGGGGARAEAAEKSSPDMAARGSPRCRHNPSDGVRAGCVRHAFPSADATEFPELPSWPAPSFLGGGGGVGEKAQGWREKGAGAPDLRRPSASECEAGRYSA